MVEPINFFTPVRNEGQKTFKQNMQEGIEGYFYLGGKSAYVIPGNIKDNSQEVELKYSAHSNIKNVILGAIKIASYITLIIPLIMLIAKAVYRYKNKFHTTTQSGSVKPQTTNRKTEDKKTHTVPSSNPLFLQNYYSNADQMSFWDSYLDSYIEAVTEWNSPQRLRFLNEEFQGIKSSLGELLQNVQSMKKELQNKIDKSDTECQKDVHTFTLLENRVKELIDKADNSLEILQIKLQDDEVTTGQKAKGFKNVGNTCYINSALQPLLAIKNFEQLVPEFASIEPECNFSERQAILGSFRDFLNSWKADMPAKHLGEKIGKLRKEIFKAGLWEGGFLNRNQERRYQDSGQFFELILHVIGKGFQLEISKTPVQDDGTIIADRTRTESNPQGVFYLQNPGNSIQEIVNGYQNASDETFSEGNEWRVGELMIANYQETQKIVGEAPEILVIRVNNHVVNPEDDKVINFAPLFENPPEDSDYELVGFSQNHHQVHWTSVVYNEGKWNYCNDSNVREIAPSKASFKHPANYMIFKKRS